MPPEDEAIRRLFEPSLQDLAEERELIAKGMVPERWIALRQHEYRRLGGAFSLALLERTPPDVELPARRDFVWQALHSRLPLFLEHHGESGYYATHRSLMQTLWPIVDMEAAKALVPSPDSRLPFHISRSEVVSGWLIEGITTAFEGLPNLTGQPIRDMPPLTQAQFDTMVEFIASSGMPLQPPKDSSP